MKKDWKTLTAIILFASLVLAGIFYGKHVNEVEEAKREAQQRQFFEEKMDEMYSMSRDLIDLSNKSNAEKTLDYLRLDMRYGKI